MRRSLAFALLSLVIASPSCAAITCTGASFSFDTPTNPQAQSYTVPSVTNGITFAYAATRNNNRAFTAAPTLGGVTMTQLQTRQTDGSNTAGSVYYLLNVAAGAKTFTGNYDAVPLSLDYTFITCDGVHQSTPISNSNVATGSGATVSVGCTSAVGELVVDFAGANGNTALGSGAGQTFISQASPAADNTLAAGSSSEAGASGTVTMSHSITSSTWHTFCASLTPVVTASSAFGPLHRRMQ